MEFFLGEEIGYPVTKEVRNGLGEAEHTIGISIGFHIFQSSIYGSNHWLSGD